jgi:site-specific recombinase XerD
MSPLRYRMIEDMQVRNLAPDTQRAYLQQITQFACHFGKSPEILGPAEIRAYHLHLTRDRQLSASSILVAVSALRFIYKVTLKRRWSVDEVIPACRKPQKLPVVMSQEEVYRFLDAVKNLKHRVILTICYAAGLRVSEAVRLTPAAIDPQRMVIHVEEGKGRKDRYVMLSPKLLAFRPPEGVAVSRRSAPTTDLDVRGRARLQEGEAPIQYRQTSHTPLPAPRLCRPPA